MAVVKRKRKQSRFEVIHYFYKLRKEVTNLLLRDFGYNESKAYERVSKTFGGIARENVTLEEQERFDFVKSRNDGFSNWFISYQRDVLMDCISKASEYIFQANSIYPSVPEELIERRIFQDKAVGQCYRMLQEIQYTIEILPVNVSKYSTIIEMINKEIVLLKSWRKGDNKFKRNF